MLKFPVIAFSLLLFFSTNSLLVSHAHLDGDSTVTKPRPKKKHPLLDVIVLDAGHGGKDPGAIGTHGYQEKKATLAIVQKLGKLIEDELSGVEVVYTRKSDKFIELYRRGEIANEKKGKLFISIHCNSTPEKPTKAGGMATYILRPGKTDAAIRVAARENAVIEFEKNKKRYDALSDIDFILTSMSRSQDVKFSEKFASLVQKELRKSVGLKSNGVEQAGFFVLVGASMPNVLIETAYISNPKEESLLKSDAGQLKYAKGILEAIKKYKETYEDS
ncbi:MAG: N-acetylmuramoyl-L-alanine amidase [Bacteroidota bacterium]|nr:N-acetylmuramoyl-L-alanine amidase [Bacteroidota bacterium]MDP4237825.1 N-acetylmuramoyl-L-alanine amidase [Bacteroidota bacterium]